MNAMVDLPLLTRRTRRRTSLFHEDRRRLGGWIASMVWCLVELLWMTALMVGAVDATRVIYGYVV